MRKILRISLILLAVLIILGTIFSVWGSLLLRRSVRDFPAVGSFVEVEGGRLHYVERGAGQPVVMIHGSDGILQDFTLTIFDSVATTLHAVAFDRPGHGYSDRPPGEPVTLRMTARLIHEAVKKLHLERPILVGHSYGGAVALQYALDYPNDLSGLVLLSPGCYPDGMPYLRSGEKAMEVMGPLLGHNMFVPLARAMGTTIIKPSFAPNPVDTEYANLLREFSSRPEQFRALADEVVHFGAGLDSITGRYREIRVPTSIIVGDSDRITLPDKVGRRLAATIPDARLTVLPGTGHMVHHVHPEVVIAAIRRMADQMRTIPN